MTSEQILQALRMVCMGRPNHPDVVELAEYLAKLGAKPEAPVVVEQQEDEQTAEDKPKRGRKPKAE